MLKQGEVFGHQRVADLINLCKSLSCHVHTLSCQKVAAVLNALLLNVSEVAACLQASTAPINELISYCRILIWKGFKTEGLEGLALIVASEYLRLSADHLLSCAILDQSFMYMVCRLHATNAVFLPDAGYFLESVAATVCRFRGKIGPRTISKVAIRYVEPLAITVTALLTGHLAAFTGLGSGQRSTRSLASVSLLPLKMLLIIAVKPWEHLQLS